MLTIQPLEGNKLNSNLREIARMQAGQTLQQCTLHVDLGAIEHNCTLIRSHIGSDCGFCAVVKADGYGLGAVRVASRLSKHAELLAVYSPAEAGDLLTAGVTTPILVLAPVYAIDRFHPMYRGLCVGQVHLTVHGNSHIIALQELAKRYGIPISVHLKIDTGLHRGGCDFEYARDIIESLQADSRLSLRGIMTHFASAVDDEALTKLQHHRLDTILNALEIPITNEFFIHEANTAAAMQWKWSHRNMVRLGLAWTGTVPNGVPALNGFRPVVSWTTKLAHVKQVNAGDLVGYSGRWTAKRESLIGIVPVGYASGYPMGVGEEVGHEGACVCVLDGESGIRIGDATVIGSVCMDQIAIDVTDIPNVGVGSIVELISTRPESKASLQNIAIAAGVVPHAIISRISPNVPRKYKTELPIVVANSTSSKSKCV